MKIAVMGYGTIGSGVVEVLEINKDKIAERAGEPIEVKYVLDLREFPGTSIENKIVHDYKTIAQDPEIGIVVETMGGVEPAFTFVKEMLEAGKQVATSNKNLVAAKGAELIKIARDHGVNFQFEASVGGGIPIIRPLNKCLTADEIEEITGILNGTTNYMLTKMAEEGADVHILTSLCDIAWLLNIRGGDIQSVPVVLSYLVLTRDQCIWFLQEEVVDDTIRAYLKENHIETRPYDDIYTYVPTIPESAVVLMNKSSVNYRICSELNKNIQVINKPNPTELMKAVKNPVEVDNTRLAHVKDGVAVTKFMYWLKTNIGKIPMTEISASDYLEARRREQENFIDLSFTTISAYGANAAMMHYHADETNAAVLKPEGMLLVDSGGQYLRGTTDITRTIALGPVTDKMKMYYTLTLKGMLSLANAKFLKGCNGFSLDILARAPLWNVGMDYRCGTGHGIGYLLNVHESPNGFRWKHNPGKNDLAVIEEGMVTSDEPGVYIEGEFGIRIENEIVCQKDFDNEYGTFLKFDMLTVVPIDLELVDVNYLDSVDIERLNKYQERVYQTLEPYFDGEEKSMLREATRPIGV